MRVVRLDELRSDCLGAVGGAIVDDDEFPVEVSRRIEGKALVGARSCTKETVQERGGKESWRKHDRIIVVYE